MFPSVTGVIAMFQTQITAFDVSVIETDGRAVPTRGPDYIISGVIQPATPEQLNSLPEGERTDSGKTIHTKFKFTVNGTGENSQSYIRHNGTIWKVIQSADWGEVVSGGFYRYICASVNRRSDLYA